MENSLQNQGLSNKLNLKNFSKSKKISKQNMLIENNNFAPNIYIQSPIINIQKNFSKKEKFNLKNKTFIFYLLHFLSEFILKLNKIQSF